MLARHRTDGKSGAEQRHSSLCGGRPPVGTFLPPSEPPAPALCFPVGEGQDRYFPAEQIINTRDRGRR